MNKKIFENSHFCPKGDIEANWNKAVGFVPLDKEIIIYKKDDTHSVPRIKIGDGVTVIQELPFVTEIEGIATEKWVAEQIASIDFPDAPQSNYEQNDNTAADYIKNRPFHDYIEEVFNWNGDTSDKEVYLERLVRVSNQTFTLEQLQGYTLELCTNEGSTIVLADFEDDPELGCYMESNTGWLIYVYDPDATEATLGLPLPTGMYTTDPKVSDGMYAAKLYKGAIKQLDEKFIPNTIARVDYVDNAIANINVPEQIQADYAQNDANANDYINNRPFYDTRHHIPAATFLPTNEHPVDPDTVHYDYCNYSSNRFRDYRLLTTNIQAITDEAVITYQTMASTPDGGAQIQTFTTTLKDKPELLKHLQCFKMNMGGPETYYTDGWYAVDDGTRLQQVISVFMPDIYYDGTFKQLDEKFIPDTIARVDAILALEQKVKELEAKLDSLSFATVQDIEEIFNEEV